MKTNLNNQQPDNWIDISLKVLVFALFLAALIMPFLTLTSCSKNDETTKPDLSKPFMYTVSTFAIGSTAFTNENYIDS